MREMRWVAAKHIANENINALFLKERIKLLLKQINHFFKESKINVTGYNFSK